VSHEVGEALEEFMAWTASVLSKTRPRADELIIIVRYTDGTNNVDETYITRGIPDSVWIEKSVRDKIKQLNGLGSYVEPPVGPITPLPDTTDPDPNFTAFMADLRRFRSLWDLLVMTEIVLKTNTKIVTLQDSIKSRIATYVDRIG
jgi:hypothetical protein